MRKTIFWKKDRIYIINQKKLPQELVYKEIKNIRELRRAIRNLEVRGAPAIGIAAALGVVLGIKNICVENFADFKKELDKIIAYLSSARPTAVNLFWALEKMRDCTIKNQGKDIQELKRILFSQAKQMIKEEQMSCRKIGAYGASLIKSGSNILTICNAGALATVDYGTALGVIYCAKELKKKMHVYVLETRPLLQGARLTAWELKMAGIPFTLITDHMAASLMQQGKIDLVIAGADRIAANGDTANKIGTYSLAVLAHYHKIPFYIAAPTSTFDLGAKSKKDIPIEQRDPREITHMFFKKPIAPKGTKVYNPAFDISPSRLIHAFITEKGIIKKPYKKNIQKLLC